MKILLVQPPAVPEWSRHVFAHKPLALEYIGAGLKAYGHTVEIFDARFDSGLEETFRRLAPDIAGLTAYTVHVPWALRTAGMLKRLSPRVFIAAGGHHATVKPEDFNSPDIGAVVIGEGVSAMRELAACIDSGRQLDGIRGLGLPGSPMRFTPARPYPSLDSLPFPDRSLTARHRRHYFSEWLKPLASVRTSLGCPFRCNFCALWSITGSRYLRRAPESVVEELKTVEEKNVFFCDDESMVDAGRMDRLADLIRKEGLRKKYFLYARVDTIARNPGLFAKWRDIGLSQVFVGLESFSGSRLSGMGKDATVEQTIEAAGILSGLGILLYGSLIVESDFSREDFRALTAFVRKLDLRYATFSVLTPFPGTRLYAEREKELISRKYELFDLLHSLFLTRLPVREFYSEFSLLYEKALPLRHRLGSLARGGVVRGFNMIRQAPKVMAAIREGYLDYDR